MKKAIVFCGGGSKGAFEMGVWDLLEELGLKYDIVCGTSIGSLNGAMYCQGTYELCSHMWDIMTNDMIMKNGFTYDSKVAIKVALKQRENLLSFIHSYFKYKGADISPLYKLVDDYIDVQKIRESKVTLGIVASEFPSLRPVEVVVNKLSDEMMKKYLIGSVSCFPIFPVCKINNDLDVIDGGYYDNLPINYAISLGASEIVAIDLNENATHPEFLNKPYVKYIKPSWNLGAFLAFEKNLITQNRTLGYNDAKKAFGLLLGFRYSINDFNTYLNSSRKYIIYVANIVGLMRLNKIKTHVKPEIEGDIFYLLERHTVRPLTDKEYFIRAVELASEFFSIDHLTVYDIDDLFGLIGEAISRLESNDSLMDEYEKLKTENKKRDYISRIDDKALVKYLYNYVAWNEDIQSNLLINILACKPNVFNIYVLMKIVSENSED